MLQAHKTQQAQEKLEDLFTHYFYVCCSCPPEKQWQLLDTQGALPFY